MICIWHQFVFVQCAQRHRRIRLSKVYCAGCTGNLLPYLKQYRNLSNLICFDDVNLVNGQQPADRQSQMQGQPRLWAVEVDLSDFVDAIHPVEQCITMNDQHIGCLR